MKKYTTLLFDLDNTLLDFSLAERICVKKVFEQNNLPSDDDAADLYSLVNDGYWKAYERGEIKAEDIYVNRFITFGEKIGIKVDGEKLFKEYTLLLSKCSVKKPFCDEILEYCKQNGYDISIITNGIAYNQRSRISLSGIINYISHIFISEELGAQKPEKAFFDRALENLKEKDKTKILVIGDSVTSDIAGAINTGLDSCFLGEKDCNATYKIMELKELINII